MAFSIIVSTNNVTIESKPSVLFNTFLRRTLQLILVVFHLYSVQKSFHSFSLSLCIALRTSLHISVLPRKLHLSHFFLGFNQLFQRLPMRLNHHIVVFEFLEFAKLGGPVWLQIFEAQNVPCEEFIAFAFKVVRELFF